jgi:hypothetical protein
MADGASMEHTTLRKKKGIISLRMLHSSLFRVVTFGKY